MDPPSPNLARREKVVFKGNVRIQVRAKVFSWKDVQGCCLWAGSGSGEFCQMLPFSVDALSLSEVSHFSSRW